MVPNRISLVDKRTSSKQRLTRVQVTFKIGKRTSARSDVCTMRHVTAGGGKSQGRETDTRLGKIDGCIVRYKPIDDLKRMTQ